MDNAHPDVLHSSPNEIGGIYALAPTWSQKACTPP